MKHFPLSSVLWKSQESEEMGRVRQSESSPPWPGGYESVMILRTESGSETHTGREPTFAEALSILNVTTYYPHVWGRHTFSAIFQMRKQGLRQLSQTRHGPSFGPRADSLLWELMVPTLLCSVHTRRRKPVAPAVNTCYEYSFVRMI